MGRIVHSSGWCAVFDFDRKMIFNLMTWGDQTLSFPKSPLAFRWFARKRRLRLWRDQLPLGPGPSCSARRSSFFGAWEACSHRTAAIPNALESLHPLSSEISRITHPGQDVVDSIMGNGANFGITALSWFGGNRHTSPQGPPLRALSSFGTV